MQVLVRLTFLHFLDNSFIMQEKSGGNSMTEMKEIQIDDNDTGLKVFVNGEPDLSLIPESLIDCFIEAVIDIIVKQ